MHNAPQAPTKTRNSRGYQPPTSSSTQQRLEDSFLKVAAARSSGLKGAFSRQGKGIVETNRKRENAAGPRKVLGVGCRLDLEKLRKHSFCVFIAQERVAAAGTDRSMRGRDQADGQGRPPSHLAITCFRGGGTDARKSAWSNLDTITYSLYLVHSHPTPPEHRPTKWASWCSASSAHAARGSSLTRRGQGD